MINPALTPISNIEVQAILDLSKEMYSVAVSTGMLKKSVQFSIRESDRTAQHNLFDILSFVLLPKLDEWSWIVNADDVDRIVGELSVRWVASAKSVHLSQRKPLIADAALPECSDGINLEYQDELRKITLEIERIWSHLICQVQIELDDDRALKPFLLSEKNHSALQRHAMTLADQWVVKDPIKSSLKNGW